MTMTDPIADMLTRIRNANTVKHDTVDVPASNIKKEIARILLEEGFIRGYDVIEDGKQGIIRMQLKYGQNGERVISGLKRISKPGMRIYAAAEDVPKVLNTRITLHDEDVGMLYYISEKMDEPKSEVIRKAIKNLYDEIKDKE